VNKLLLSTTVLALLAVPGAADARKKPKVAPAPVAVVQVAPTDPVELYYFQHGDAPIWLRSDATKAAAARLSGILRRAPIDGFVAGPALAAEVDAALATPAMTNAEATRAAEVRISKAWVAYMQYLRTPPKGLVYGYELLAPQRRPDQILLTTAAASDLGAALTRMSDVNSIYRSLRDAALAAGMTTATPELLSNLERARVLPAAGRFALVDAGNATLTMYENGQPVDRMKVVVGTPETQTPMIASIIHYAVLNPYWEVPPSLTKKIIAPGVLKGGDAYLKRNGYEVMSNWTNDATVVPASEVKWAALAKDPGLVRVRQRPGPLNSLAGMKIPFPSGQDIFLHDTLDKSKFNLTNRHLSNGCVRLEDAQRFYRWLHGNSPAPTTKEADVLVKLPQGVPIYLTYLTQEAGPDGKLATRGDPYGWDGRPDRQLAAATYTSPTRGAP
jgi:murein L,D-transpeptidase YcbB/YkuD